MTTLAPIQLLETWLIRENRAAYMEWLPSWRHAIASGRQQDLFLTFGLAGRRLSRLDLHLTDSDRAAAESACPGWDPCDLRFAEAARLLLLLDVAGSGGDFAATFQSLCATADVSEAVTLYRGLPLYPDPASLHWQVGEGLRTSIEAVFTAIAHRNPFPRAQFDEARWNHMVLKALFLGVPLAPIQGFDARRNPELALIAARYADERRAAGRAIPPELWRCVGPFATGALFDTVAGRASSTNMQERVAVALALQESPDARVPAILAGLPEENRLIRAGLVSWSTLGSLPVQEAA